MQLYTAIKELLTEIKTTDDKPFFNTVDLWNGQTELPTEEQAFRLPAAFLEFSDITYERQLNGVQNALCEFTIHVVTDSRRAKLEQCLQGSTLLCSLLNSWLFQFASAGKFGSIVRTRSQTDQNFDEWIENRETYVCNIVDYSARRTFTSVDVDNIAILCGIRRASAE